MRPAPALSTGTVTFLFTDIEGSTRLLQQLPDEYPELQSELHRLLREAVDAADGASIGSEGDSLFARGYRPPRTGLARSRRWIRSISKPPSRAGWP